MENIQLAKLTVDEQAEFTAFNLIAHTVDRETTEAKVPVWLCTSDEAKDAARQKAVDWLNENLKPIVPIDELTAKRHAEKLFTPHCVQMQAWREKEAHFKYLRDEEANPGAFFAD